MEKLLHSETKPRPVNRYTQPRVHDAGDIRTKTEAGGPEGAEATIVWGEWGPIAVKPRE